MVLGGLLQRLRGGNGNHAEESREERVGGEGLIMSARPLLGGGGGGRNNMFACITTSRLGMDRSQRVELVKEPKTGLDLPGEYCTRGASACSPLAGLGVRVKKIAGIGVKVYAAGLYIDAEAAKKAVGDKYKGKSAAAVAKDDGLYSSLLTNPGIEKTVRLVFARDLDSKKISDALVERLVPRLGAGSPSIKEFEKFFDGIAFKKGQSLTFSAVKGALHTNIRGTQVADIKDSLLCEALFEAYLGPDPVIPQAKKALGEELAGYLLA